MSYGSFFHKSVKVLMVLGISTQILGSSLIHVPLVFADGSSTISITRNDGIVSNYSIGPSTSMTGMSFNLNASTNFIGSGLNIIATSVDPYSCNSADDIGNIMSEISLYQSGTLVGTSSTVIQEYLPFTQTTGCVYHVPYDLNLVTGSNQFDLLFSTTGGFVGPEQGFYFAVSSDSFPNLISGSGDVITSGNFIGSPLQSATFVTNNAGVTYIARTYTADPQIAIRETEFTAVKFAIQANPTKDLALSGFSVSLSGYDNAAGGIYSAMLFVDDSNEPIATGFFANGTGIIFTGFNAVISASTYRDFWVKVVSTASVPTAGSGSSYDLQFVADNFILRDSGGYLITIPGEYQSVVGNRIDIKDEITVVGNRTSATPTTIIPADTQTGIIVGTFELQPDYASVLIEELTLVNVDNTFYNTSLTSDTVSGHINTSGDGAIVELYQDTTKVGEAQLLNGIAYVDLVSLIAVSPGTSLVLTVKVRSNAMIASAGDTNKAIKLGLLNPGTLGLAQTLITVPGYSINATGSFMSVLFNTQLLRATTIYFTDQAIPDQGANNLLSIAGQNEAVLFKTVLTANSSKSASIKTLLFNHASNGVNASNFKLKVDGTVLSTGDATCAFASNKVTCIFDGVYANGLTISTGNRTISLVADITPSIASNDYITTSLNEGAPADYSMNTVAGVNPAATVIWSDNAEPNVTSTSANWFTDAGIEKLPSNSWTFIREGGEGGSCGNGATNYPACDNNVAATNVTITRTDSFFFNRNVPVNATGILGMSFNLNINESRNISQINTFITNSSTGACTNDTDVNNVITKASLYMSGTLVGEDILSEGCMYQFMINSGLVEGSNLFDIRFDTHSGALDGIPIRFTVDSSSIGTLSTGSTTITNPTINGSATSIYSIIRRPGVESIAKTYVANPQIAIRGNDVTAIKFAIRANNVSDLVVRGFDTTVALGTTMSGGLQDALLYTEGVTGIIDIEPFSGVNTVSFSGLSVPVPAGTLREFWVLVSTTTGLESSGASNLQFTATNFSVEDSSGNPVSVSITVSGNIIDVKDGIEVFANRTSATPTTIIPADTQTGITVGTFELQPDYGDVLVEELTFINLINSFTGTVVNSNTISGYVNTSTDGAIAQVYHNGNLVGEAQLLNGIAYVDLVNPIAVSPGAPVSFTVKIRSNTVITSAGDTNKFIRLGLLDPGELGIGTTQTLISPVDGSYAVAGSFINLIFNTQLLRATSLTFADQFNPTQGQANNIFAIEAMSERTLFRTIATTHSSKSALIKQLIFNHTTGGLVTTENFKLKVDGTMLSTGDATCAFASNKVACIFSGAYANGLTIAAGGSRTIELMGDVGVSLQNGDYITTSLNEGAPADYSMNTVAGVNPAATVIWSDNAEPNVAPTSANWFTDAGIEKLPSNSWTFVRSDEGGSCTNGATNYPACDNNQIILTNLTYTKSIVNPTLYTIYWHPIQGSSKVEISAKDVVTDIDYTKINTVLAASGITTINLTSFGTYMIKLTPVDDLSTPLGPDQIITIVHEALESSLPVGSQTCDYYMSEGGGFGPPESMLLKRHLKEIRFGDGSIRVIGTGFGVGQGYSPYGVALIPWGQTVGLEFTGGVDLYPEVADAPSYVHIRTNVLLSGVVGVTQNPDRCIDGSGNTVGEPGELCPQFTCVDGPCENPYHMVSGSMVESYYSFAQSGCSQTPVLPIEGRAWFENTYNGLYDSSTENTVDGANVYLYECNTGDNGSHYVSSLEELMAQLAAQGNTATNNLLATGITDYYGGYQFSGLEAGKFYNVRFGGIPGFEPAGNKYGHNNRTCVQAGTTGLDFTLLTKATVAGQTWFDADQDGVRQPGENTVDGMNMYLVQCIDDVPVNTIATGITDYYGGYQFTVPMAGTYIVTAGSIPGHSLPDSTLTDGCRSIRTQSDSWNYNLGLLPAQAIITGQTWFDTTNDGSYQSGTENTVDGMNVYLYACNGLNPSTRLVASTTTDYYGGYQFSGVGAGFYQVRIGGIPGFTASSRSSPCIALYHNDTYQFDSYLTEYTIGDPEFTAALQRMRTNGLTSATNEESFAPFDTLLGEEAAQIVNVFASGVLRLPNINNLCNFDNLSGAQAQYRTHITQLCQKGLTRHIYGSFSLTGAYTKADLVAALAKGLGGYQEDRIVTPRYQNYCTYAQDKGITHETNCSALDRPMTKYEAALMLYRGRELVPSDHSNILYGTAFFDEDSNFNYQSGENTVDGMNVYLKRCNSDVALATTTTDYYGGYQFSGLLDGDYTIQFGGIPGFESYKGFDEYAPCFSLNQSHTGDWWDIPLMSNYPKVGGYQTGLHLRSQGSYVVTHDFTLQNSGSVMNQLKSITIEANRIVGDSWFTLSEMIDSIRITNKTNGSVSYLSGFTSARPMMWTPWIDRDDPSGDGDAEYYDTASPNNTLPIRDACDGREGIVQVVTTDTNQTPEQVGQVVRYSQSNRGRGYQCLNSQNPGGCRDYQVRFLCNNDTISKNLALTLTGGVNSIEVAIKFNNGYPQSITPYDMTLDISSLGYGSSYTGVFDVIDSYLILSSSPSMLYIDPYKESPYTMWNSHVVGYQLKYIASGSQSRIAGQTWFDMNLDGIKQATELTVDGMNVGLYHCMMSGSQSIATNYLVSQTKTDYYGGYQFVGLIPGWYQVRAGGLSGYQHPVKQSECLYVDTTVSKNFDSYLVAVPPATQGGGGGGGAGSASSSSSSSSNTSVSIDALPEVKTTPKTTNTTPNNQKENTSTTSQTPSNLQIVTTNQLSDSSVSPKQIVTIKINDDGSISIVQPKVKNQNIQLSDTPKQYLARDLQIQQQTSPSNNTNIAPIEFKPYWVITPEMIMNISMLQDGYQPTWDATPFKVSVVPSDELSAWDSPSTTVSQSFYQKIDSLIKLIRR